MKIAALALAAILPCLAASPEVDKGKTLGNPAAPVKIELFSDFLCPQCRNFHQQTLPLLMKDFVNPGKVCIVSREFPLSIPGHEHSREAATYATAAARVGKYTEVADALFNSAESWRTSGKVWETVASALTPEQQKRVQALVKDPMTANQVQSDVSLGVSSGINGTPTMIVTRGSQKYPVSGYPLNNYSLLKSLLNDLTK